jgi:hypothetical protein
MKKSLTVILSLFTTFLLIKLSGCEENNLNEDDHSSFGLIQNRIFNSSCAISGCHASDKDPSFAQHKLVLSEGFAYKNLVNVESENGPARLDGLKRVSPGDSENSLLHHKLHCDDGHHSQDYGNMMPIGLDPLSQGQIDFITAWIDEGASRTKIINADPSLLDDNVPGCEENFTNLDVPAESEGYQIKIDAFDVPPQFEREIFVYKEVGNREEFFLNKVVMKMRRNSHHFLVSNYQEETPARFIPEVNVIRDLRDANGKLVPATLEQMEYQAFTIASQTPELEYAFPQGVALKIPAQYKLDMNLHYVNKSHKVIQGECSMNLYKVAPEQVVHEAKPVFFSNGSIFLPARQKTIVIREFDAGAAMKIFMLTSHTHKLGERFEIQIKGGARNGELIYASEDWHHPVIKTFDTPVEIQAGEGLRMIVTFNNTTDNAVKYGLTSEDEMAIIYGYYY